MATQARQSIVFGIGLWCLVALATQTLARAQTHKDASQAACVIRLGTQTLLTQDPWSQRYALPGGLAEAGESLARAAAHQTQRTTGLVVEAHRPLGTLGNVAVFDCRLQAPLALLPRHVVRIPADARYTTIEARFIDVSTLKPSKWRYRHDAEGVAALCAAAREQDPAWVQPSEAPSSPMFEAELTLTRVVQTHVPPGLRPALGWASIFGTEAVLCLVAIVVWCACGERQGLEFTLYLMTVCLLNCWLKQHFELPRPFYLDPRLQLAQASSFGFPSGHTTCATSIALWCAARVLPRGWVWRCLLVACVLSCSLSRVYLGVHFAHDVVGAWLESLAVWGLYMAWLKRTSQPQMPLRHWLMLSLALGGLTLWAKPEPDPIVFLCVIAGLLLGARKHPLQLAPLPWRYATCLGMVMMVGFVAIEKATARAQPTDATFAACVQLTVCSGLAHGLWMPWVSRVVRRFVAGAAEGQQA